MKIATGFILPSSSTRLPEYKDVAVFTLALHCQYRSDGSVTVNLNSPFLSGVEDLYSDWCVDVITSSCCYLCVPCIAWNVRFVLEHLCN